MRRSFLLTVLVVVCLGAAPQKKPDPLPPLNAKVLEYAKGNLGRPAGDGICITLAVEALESAGAKRSDFREANGDYVWGDPVPNLKQALPGDILQFRDAVFQGQTSLGGRTSFWHQEYPHHTAVVARVERGGKLITIYHQNVAAQGRPEYEKGNVRQGQLRMDALQPGGWVKAYRPVPNDQPPSRRSSERSGKQEDRKVPILP